MAKYTTFDSFFNLVKSMLPAEFKDHIVKPAISVDVYDYGSKNMFFLGLLDKTDLIEVKLTFNEYCSSKEIQCPAIDKMIYEKNPYMMLRGYQALTIDEFIDITELDYDKIVQYCEKRINDTISNLLKTKGQFGIILRNSTMFKHTPYFKSFDELLVWNDLNPS